MSVQELKNRVCEANVTLGESGLVVLTWGNVSGADRDADVMAIKPSGVPYDKLTPDEIVVVSLSTGEVVEGALAPSSDTPTHLELYRDFAAVCGIVHTHSTYASAWAQAHREIPCLGTTHADFAHGPVPLTGTLTEEQIEEDYEANTGRLIVECLASEGRTASNAPAVLVAGHGPFAWGATPDKALENAVILEEIARMAAATISINSDVAPLPPALLDKHFLRKHGPDAYYGQQS